MSAWTIWSDELIGGKESMEKVMPVFGQRLKALRQEKHMTQREMAVFLEKTERHYQDMEAGKINIPSLTLIKLADFFDVSTDYLLGRKGQK